MAKIGLPKGSGKWLKVSEKSFVKFHGIEIWMPQHHYAISESMI